ncbi:6155_t:CDS:2 [Paraglomus occultum]|uniref:6155_t:CDS:1 n=1 Tax=Paraglomus occultum TaxID=144539 RepID=A0A9N9DY97_9GLOM|nr:6155_t:CDS:2 [Paraglomus occultum]
MKILKKLNEQKEKDDEMIKNLKTAGDYERLQKKLTTQKKEIFREINNSLELGLESKKLTLKKIITRIEELIRNPLANNQKLQKKLTKAKKTIELLKKQLAEKDPDYNAIQQAEYQKILKLVKNDTFQNCKKLGIALAPSTQAKISQATTLDLVMKERNKLIQSQFSKNQAELTQQKSQLTHARHQER